MIKKGEGDLINKSVRRALAAYCDASADFWCRRNDYERYADWVDRRERIARAARWEEIASDILAVVADAQTRAPI